MKKNNKSQKLYIRAKKIIPGGVSLYSKRPENYLPNLWPTYYSKTDGINVWDLNNKKYKDFFFGVGQNILGYNNRVINNSVIKACSSGNMSSLNCPEEVELAEKLIEMHNWADMVKYARTGGEANAIAIRIARAASGKDNIAICGYHGWHDWYLSANLKNKTNLNKHLLDGLLIDGVPKRLRGTVYPFQYNDFEELERIVKKNNIGVIKMEARREIEPKAGFLKKIRKLCDKKGIVLIFDECTSGFRETFGGIHKLYKVNPDIAIFGKALGNGYAITAIIGKKKVMSYAQNTFISSTFWTEKIGPTAAVKTLEIMKKKKSWIKITKSGKIIKKLWKEIANNNDIKINIMGIDALPQFNFCNKQKNLEYKTLISQEMLKQNYLSTGLIYVSILHNKNNIYEYIDKLDNVFKLIKRCEYGEKVSKFLKTKTCNSGFKRLTT